MLPSSGAGPAASGSGAPYLTGASSPTSTIVETLSHNLALAHTGSTYTPLGAPVLSLSSSSAAAGPASAEAAQNPVTPLLMSASSPPLSAAHMSPPATPLSPDSLPSATSPRRALSNQDLDPDTVLFPLAPSFDLPSLSAHGSCS
jgi:hypothetical protein